MEQQAGCTMSPPLTVSARPTIRVDTQEYAKVNELLLGMEMNESEGGMSALELRFTNWASAPGGADFAYEDGAIFKLGASIEVYGGDVSAPVEIFRGVVTGLEGAFPLEGPPELTVLAEDAFQKARMKRKTALHDNATISDLASAVASQLGLTPVITGFSDSIGLQVQLNQSDLAFLRRLLARYDGDLQIVGTEMHVAKRDAATRGSTITLRLHSELHSARIMADLAHQVTETTSAGWNISNANRVTGSSTSGALGPGSGTAGNEVLRSAIGDRKYHVESAAVTTSDEATAIADAEFAARTRRFVRIEGTAEGDPGIRVGVHVTIEGVGPRFGNTFYVTRTCHRYDLEQGYTTDFEGECAFLGP
jgi:uncharacterized protein